MSLTNFSLLKQSLSVGVRRILADSETLLIVGLSASACILLILILAVTLQKCSRSPRIEVPPHSGGSESAETGDMPLPSNDATGAEPKGRTADSAEEQTAGRDAARAEERGGRQANDVLVAPSPARRRDLARHLGAISRPNELDFENDGEDPFLVYRSIRDNCEYITSVLIQMVKYVDSDSTHRLRIAAIEKAHDESMGSEYDDDYCSYRISQGLQNGANLSVLIARCLHEEGGGEALISLVSQLQHLPRDRRRSNAVCVEVSAIAWDGILGRMANARNITHRSGQVQHRFGQEGSVMERYTTTFLTYAELLEQGTLALCPDSASRIEGARRVRERTVTGARSKYVQIAAAAAALSETHALLAESLCY